MIKRLELHLEEETVNKLYKYVGKGNMSQFVENAIHTHLLVKRLNEMKEICDRCKSKYKDYSRFCDSCDVSKTMLELNQTGFDSGSIMPFKTAKDLYDERKKRTDIEIHTNTSQRPIIKQPLKDTWQCKSCGHWLTDLDKECLSCKYSKAVIMNESGTTKQKV